MGTLDDVPDLGDNAFYLRKAHVLVSTLQESGSMTPDLLIKRFRSRLSLSRCIATNVLAYASVHGMINYDPAIGMWGLRESSSAVL